MERLKRIKKETEFNHFHFPETGKFALAFNLRQEDFEWLIKQAEKVNKIKDFCEYESTVYADSAKENPHNVKRIFFEGKKDAFDNVLNHMKNLEEN